MNNSTIKSSLLAASSVVVLSSVIATAAFAQSGGGDVEQVVVSASRISIAGYTQPTPVTVVGAEVLQRDAKTDIGDAIRDLPAVGDSDSPSNGATASLAAQGNAGVDDVNLRNLGIARTLTLFDGQRVVSSNPAGGGVDLSTIPTALIERIDVVTGGASAAWGSDAVSGVVNLVLNKNFTGIKGSVQYSNNEQMDHQQEKGDLSYGTDFAGGRGHFVVSATYTMSPDQIFYSMDKWWSPQMLFPNPGTGPTYLHVGNFGNTAGSAGGIIQSSTAATTAGPSGLGKANALQGIQFVGPNATVTPFNGFTPPFNGVSGWVSSLKLCTNCSATPYTDLQAYSSNATPYHNTTLFGYARYKLTDTIQASLQLNYGQNYGENSGAPIRKLQTIKSDNPYIPSSVSSTMTAYGITSFVLGFYGLQGTDPHNLTTLSVDASDGITDNQNTRALSRGVFTLEGSLGDDWSWNAYVELSQLREQQHDPNNDLTANYNLAIDAVAVTAANQGTSGLPIGSIQCRSTLTAPTNGCSPFNPFGSAGPSPDAVRFIEPGEANPAVMDQSHYFLNQNVVEGSMQGVLPWKVPAGGVAVAFGAGYRHDQQTTLGDPNNYGASAGWNSANYTSFRGGLYVYEGFGEVTVPILKDDIVQSLEVNAAGRITSYSTSGMVETWKLGATSQINDDIRLRTTWSEDIRAPLLIELFQKPAFSAFSAVDPKTNITVTTGFYANQGNANLVPEQANTVSGGVVLTPHWIDGLQLSADWYSIVIKQAIFTPTAPQVAAQCAQGSAIFCADNVYAAPGIPVQYPGALNEVILQPQNAAAETTSGLDFEADYRTDLFGGQMSWHAVANYNDERTKTFGGVTFDTAGCLGADCPAVGTTSQAPKFRGTLSSTYTQGPWSGTVQGRFIGAAVLNNYWTSGVQVDNNNIPWVAYLDLRASYKWSDNIQLFAAVDNVNSAPPPRIPNTLNTGGGINLAVYDGIGRDYRIGLRFNF